MVLGDCSMCKYLANQSIAYRGTTVKKDHKTFDSEPRGNFTTLLKHTATYHSNLRVLLTRDQYTSPKVQNYIIYLFSQELYSRLLGGHKNEFYAFLLDENTDINNNSQLSAAARFVSNCLKIEELCLGVFKSRGVKAEDLFNDMAVILNRVGLHKYNLRAQGYDGCNTMAGQHTGLAARVRIEYGDHILFLRCKRITWLLWLRTLSSRVLHQQRS